MLEPELSPGRRALFWAIALALPLAVGVCAEGVARLVPSKDDRHVTLVGSPVFFARDEAMQQVRVVHPEMYRAQNATFFVPKPAGRLRVFTAGGSASAGWPHPPGETYPALLQRALRRVTDSEVIDVSAHAWAAYRVRWIVEEALAFEPDAVVVYSGNNEFLERRRYLPHALPDALERLALVGWLRRLLIPLLSPANALTAERRDYVAQEVWSKIRRESLELRADPAQYDALVEHYAASLEGMARAAGARGVPMVLVTVPVNLRDWKPNASVRGSAGAERERAESALRRGRVALLDGDAEAAEQALREAAALDPGHAETHFWLGRALEAREAWPEAAAQFRRAADLDHNPFRATSRLDDALRAIAERYPHVWLADASAAFAAASAPRAPGFDLFLDYVHPTREGNRLVARTVFEALGRSGVGGEALAGAAFVSEPDPSYAEDDDARLQSARLQLFAMMHQHESLLEALAPLRAKPGSEWDFARDMDALFSAQVALERQGLRGRPVDPEQARRQSERLDRFYAEKFVALDPEPGSGS